MRLALFKKWAKMLEIKRILIQMEDELNKVGEYSILAMKYQKADPELGETYHSLAKQELEHYNILHSQSLRLVEKAKERNNTFSSMVRKYDEYHTCLIKKLKDAEEYLNLYNR